MQSLLDSIPVRSIATGGRVVHRLKASATVRFPGIAGCASISSGNSMTVDIAACLQSVEPT